MLSSCLPAFGSLVPAHYTELTRDELQRLYKRSLNLNDGRLIVHGLFARAGTENVNKRIYPKELLQREVTRFEEQHVSKGTALGEMEHPSYSSMFYKCLNLPNVSHQVLELTWKGGQLWGTIEVLPTPAGLLVWELYSQGVKLGVSSRGWATLRADPKSRQVYVDHDYELITFDFVVEPSTRDAFVVPVRKRYRGRVPEQYKMVCISHMGYGAVAPKMVERLPKPQAMAQRVCEIRDACVGWPEGGQDPPFSRLPPQLLDNVLLYSHYMVHPLDLFLHREPNQRSFQHHLALIATKALLATAARATRPFPLLVPPSQRSSSSIGQPASPTRMLINPAPSNSSRAAAVAAGAHSSNGAEGRLPTSNPLSTPDGSVNDLSQLASGCGGGEEVTQEVRGVLEGYLARLQEVRNFLSQHPTS